MSVPLIEVRDAIKDYRSLRPLRLRLLELHDGEAISLLGFDEASAEVLVNLLTGAVLPDSGSITVFGQDTAAIADARQWVTTLDQFGLISERAVMLDQLTSEQNLAMPVSLQIETMPPDVRSKVAQLAAEVGLTGTELHAPAGALSPLSRQRLRLGRALALEPRVLLAEHPNAPLTEPDALAFARLVAEVVATRRIASLVMTASHAFAEAVSARVLILQPGTGELKRAAGWRRWFS
jgi:ABC-type ATPase involved in cell division